MILSVIDIQIKRRIAKVPGTENTWQHEFHLRDHLGNTRVVCGDDGVMRTGEYYPFGMEFGQGLTQAEKFICFSNHEDTTNWEDRMYNGKEYQTDRFDYDPTDGTLVDLGWSDYGARYYNPSIGRFLQVDPLAEHPNQVDKSTYAYAWNNPIRYNDPDGTCPQCLPGFIIGAAVDIGIQIARNRIAGKGAFEDFSLSSALISGVAGAASGGTTSIARGIGIAAGESIAKQVITDDGVSADISVAQIASDVALGGLGGKVKIFDDANISTRTRQVDRTTRIANNDPLSTGRAQTVRDAQRRLNTANNSNQVAQTALGNALQQGSDAARGALNFTEIGVIPSPVIQVAQDNTRVVQPLIDLNKQ